VDKTEFYSLMRGYFNSKHIRPTQQDLDALFKKIDLNNDSKISFEEYDIFVRIVYETEYLPVLEREINKRKLNGPGNKMSESHLDQVIGSLRKF
jgi:Ca2+-binding EF-hand superfamily protein